MVEHEPSKLVVRVRFPSPAPSQSATSGNRSQISPTNGRIRALPDRNLAGLQRVIREEDRFPSPAPFDSIDAFRYALGVVRSV